ncbi:hypothetical protein FYJ79_09850 [Sharpea azabuensis]|uniref:DUF7601 domain-containing protein n=1 Tax=Sharpea porci TaxID=2652286 RepID=A0A844FUY2_9FIRM|nr:hypothetical protein [Sharpea porci]MST89871.1 hypothetical protein [Sharpea porci]
MKNYFKGMIAFCVSGMMALALTAPVFADQTDAKAYITKEFDMPVGTKIPDAGTTFTFDMSAVKKDGGNYAKTISQKSITFTDTDTKRIIDVNGAGNDHKIYRYLKSTPLLSTEEVNQFKADGPGVYEFTINETLGNEEPKETEDQTNHLKTTTKMTYSRAEYKAIVYVKKDNTNNNYISDIKVTKEKDDQGNTVTNGDAKKVNPSKPDDNIPGSGGLRFVNTYLKEIQDTSTENPDPVTPKADNPTDPNEARDKIFSVGKIITGDLADQNQKFAFTVKVTAPALANVSSKQYSAKIVTADGTQDGETLTFTDGVAQTVSLNHGEKLVFTDLYVGTAFEAQETDRDTFYTSTTYARLNGGIPAQKSKERELVTGNVSEGTDTVVVVNTRNSNSPTGIFVNNLPYILIVLGVLAGFVGYIAAKRKSEER